MQLIGELDDWVIGMKVLMLGDVVGSPGRKAFKSVVERYKSDGKADFVVVNAENSAGGRGLTGELAEELFKSGADVLTLGDHVWDQKVLRPYLETETKVLRPLNLQPGCPGHGHVSIESEWGRITVINLIGRVFMNDYDCPFRAVDDLLARESVGNIVIVDMHAEATSEKIVMGRHLDGKASIVAGTHTHVQTSDEAVLPGGTAYITDLGMTGPREGSLGRDLEQVRGIIFTGMPSMFKVAKGPSVVEGIVVEVDRETGRAVSVERIRELVD